LAASLESCGSIQRGRSMPGFEAAFAPRRR
jgi:hypothetical protein